jgi:hypothetical protein
MEHVSLHSVGTNHKKFGWEKNKNIHCLVLGGRGKVASLPSVDA